MNNYLVSRFRKKLKRLPVADYHGLKSPGLTCYLNSVLQVLFMTENFRDALKSPDHRCGSIDSPIVDPELRRLFDDLQKKMAETRNITEKLGITDVFEQRDAAEYFEKILCLTSPDASKIFKGELNHRTTCCKCNTQNNSSSFFWILPLMVEESRHKTYNVEQGLEAFFELQQVSGDDQLYCNSCDGKQHACFQWEITQHPDVLTLLLKRFTFDYKLKRYVKLHCKADVPQTLHMEKYTYGLYAVVNHFGSLTGGHYTAEIKSYENGQWYCFNDRRVKSVKQQLFGVEENSLRSSTAYILLYRKEPPETDGSDQDAQRANLDVEAEGRSDEVKREEATFPHYHPEKYNDKGKDIPKNFNSNLSKNCRNDGDRRKPNHTAAWTNNSVLPQVKSEADEQQHDSNTEKRKCLISRETCVEHFRKNYVELTKASPKLHQNTNSQKKGPKAHEMICEGMNSTDTKTGTKVWSPAESSPRRNGFKSSQTITEKKQKAAGKDTAIRRRSRTVRPSQDHASSVQHPTSHSKCHGKTNEPSNYKNTGNQGRHFSSLNRNTAKTQHVVTTDSKLKSKHTRIKNEQTVKVTKQKIDQIKRPPWR